MLTYYKFNVIFLFGNFLISGVICLELQSYSACYGSTGLSNFLLPNCKTGEKIAVVGLTALGKKLSTSCPIEITPLNSAIVNTSVCCQYDPTDCGLIYSTSVYRNYYSACNGKNTCVIQVSWVVTDSCNQSVYLARTNYMKIDYYCISVQGLDPCSSVSTKDSKVFLWSTGYPSSPLSGTSSCTCSVEASCKSAVKLTAIDLRFDTSVSCAQNISIIDGAVSYVFDCSSNNDYLPTILFTSTSHFIQIQINNNLLSSGGYYFLLLEGGTAGSELTLSCSAATRTTPVIPDADLLDCPNGATTQSTMITTMVTSTEGLLTTGTSGTAFQSSASDLSVKSVYTTSAPTSAVTTNITTVLLHSEPTPASMSTIQKTSFSTEPISAVMSTITTASFHTDTRSQMSSLVSTASISNVIFNNKSLSTDKSVMTNYSNIKSYFSPDFTEPAFTSLKWFSTENYMKGSFISTTTPSTKSSYYWSLGSTTSMLSSTVVSAISPYYSSSDLTTTSDFTTNSNLTTTVHGNGGEQTSSPNNTSIIAGIAVVLLVLIGMVIALILYRDKIKECFCKQKASSKVDITNDTDDTEDNPLYASIFDANLNIENRRKPLQLPPLTHHLSFPVNTRFHEKTQKISDTESKEKKKKKRRKNEQAQQDIAQKENMHVIDGIENSRNNNKKQPKRKRDKALRKLRSVVQFMPRENSYSKSTFPTFIGNMMTESNVSRLSRRTSIIDIADSDGRFEKSVEFEAIDESPTV